MAEASPSATDYKEAVTSPEEPCSKFQVASQAGSDRSFNEVLDAAMQTKDMDNQHLLRLVNERLKRANVEVPKIEVCFKELNIEAEAHLGSRVRPSILNAYRNAAEGILRRLHLLGRARQTLHILRSVSGSLQPGRFTLLLGPPGSGKSTLLKALAGKKPASNLQVTGEVTYNGTPLRDFTAVQTAAYVEQTDLHSPELTVRETLDFAARCQHTGFDELAAVVQREAELQVEADADVAAFMAACSLQGKRHSMASLYVLRMLGLEVCADTNVGSALIRGISGGQRRRLTLGEMLVAAKTVLLLDEISTGLDSSTTFQICRCLATQAHLLGSTMLVSLLQPPPETFDLFDDIILLAEGQIVFQGPKEDVLPFFEAQGFRPLPRQGTADFLQEVVSRRDQPQYWTGAPEAYSYAPVEAMVEAFGRSTLASQPEPDAMKQRNEAGAKALKHVKHAQSGYTSLKACLRREIILMQRNRFVYYFRGFQLITTLAAVVTLFVKPRMDHTTLLGGRLYLSYLFYTVYFMVVTCFTEVSIATAMLPVFAKHRDNNFFPVLSSILPVTLLRIPFSIAIALPWSVATYWAIGFAPSAGRFFIYLAIHLLEHTVAVTLFRAASAIGRTAVPANIVSFMLLGLALFFTGFVIQKHAIHGWYIWVFWASPFQWAMRALVVNEFTAPRWQIPFTGSIAALGKGDIPGPLTLGQAVLIESGFPHHTWWPGVCIAVMVGWALVLNFIVLFFMKIVAAGDARKAVISEAQADPDDSSVHIEAGAGHQKAKTKAADQASLPPDNTCASDQQLNGGANHQHSRSDASSADHSQRSKSDVQGSQPMNGTADVDVDAKQQDNAYVPSFRFQEGANGMGGVLALPMQPITLAFKDINYFVDAPASSQLPKGSKELQLLHNITGCFRPGVMTALMGATGAGKTTLMDVLACRKNSGRTQADIRVNGYPQDRTTFTRVSGYVEQADLHSPHTTVAEALWFSSRLRLPPSISRSECLSFNQQVMDLVELGPLRHAVVGLPGVSGLAVEARKRLTIAVELVANPAIVFMDEPTSGLDARAAAIVMRAVRNINDTGRTVAVTVHQPSTLVFETFDELLLLKPGGRTIYAGPLGSESSSLIAYFEAIPGVPKIHEGINPATWMLEISTVSAEAWMQRDLAEAYRDSQQCRQNVEHVDSRLQPREGGGGQLFHPTRFAQPFLSQYRIILHKNFVSYWRNEGYNASRFFFTVLIGILFGSAFWDMGLDRSSQEGVLRVAVCVYLAAMLFGFTNAATVQPAVATERTVFYRERYAGLYASIPYAIAQGDVEVPYLLVQSALFSVIVYFMIHFEFTAAKFFWWWLFQFCTLSFYTFYGIMCVALTPSLQIAAVISTSAYAMWVLFAGFLYTRPVANMRAPWWLWAIYASPTSWTLWGTVTSQLGDVEDEYLVDMNGNTVSVAQFVRDYFGFRHDWVGYTVLLLIAFIILFRVMAVWALCYLNFSKR
ncbi:hypothetical protein WJX73_009709 [Symbiochloris irregularis]|uniref:ABC transporter domain-containing protein n=1 Tax=Symbiochloris irregularis TaxID=706552 RepID=A0AAW1PRX5_9CHLO